MRRIVGKKYKDIRVVQTKIAVLILSHSLPEALNLHQEYWSNKADLYVHVDSKVPRDRIPSNHGLTFVPQINIYWGGWSMVQATMSLIETARNKKPYHRYVLISDDSTPLIPIHDMISRLSEPKEFIWIYSENEHHFVERYTNFYLPDHPATSAVWTPLEAKIMDDSFFSSVKEAENLKKRGKKPVAFRHGDQWWALSSNCINIASYSFKNDHWLTNSFRFSMVPDEQYFHTVVGKLYKEKFLFSVRNRPNGDNVFHSIKDIVETVPNGYLFARKIDVSIPEISTLVRTGIIPK